MVIRKCDRCKAEIIEKPKNMFEELAEALAANFGTAKPDLKVINFNNKELSALDLCEPCKKGLYEWLLMKEDKK